MVEPLTKNHPMSPNGQDLISKNSSGNSSIEELIETRVSRRTVIKGSLAVFAGSFLGLNLTACANNNENIKTKLSSATANALLGFKPVEKNLNDDISVPKDYTVDVLYRLGDPINNFTPEYNNDGTDQSFEYRAGDHHDGMFYFGMNKEGTAIDLNNSNRGLLCMNHENITEIFLHTKEEWENYDKKSRVPAQIDKEISAHGVSIIEIYKNNSTFKLNKSSIFNKRITAQTPMDIYGPVRNHNLVKTKYSIEGTKTRGTLNNC